MIFVSSFVSESVSLFVLEFENRVTANAIDDSGSFLVSRN